ncbi:MAG: radical SAM protein [Thermoplasmata archaeon]|nr:radical SAM protein [Thermoplasmata archaeon]
MKRRIEVFVPGTGYPSLSTTGTACMLNCAHCNGHYLKGMVDVSGPTSLLDFGMELEKRGGKGFLLSGGCDREGKVVISDAVLDQISRLKETTSLSMNVHPGLVGPDSARALAEAGVDTASFDVIQDQDTISEVLGIDASPGDYRNSYRHLIDAGIRVVPHVLAGLYHGQLRGEQASIDLISGFEPDTAVLITLIPTRGTRMEKDAPLPESELIGLAEYMVSKLDCSLMLGCMRPRGYDALEVRSLEAGFSGIVSPNRRTLEYIDGRGWERTRHELCCAVLPP